MDNNIQVSNGKITIDFISLEMEAKSHCKNICPDDKECPFYLKNLRKPSISTDFFLSTVSIIITNETDESVNIDYDKFKAIDIDGLTYSSVKLCDRYSYNRISSDYNIPPYSKAKFDILFSNVDNKIIRLYYKYNYNEELILNLDNTYNISRNDALYKIICEQKITIENLNNKIKEFEEALKQKEEYSKLNEKENDNSKTSKQRMNEDILIKYRIEEDDDYWRIFSLEEYDTISFNREFDKSKDNHNWINTGDPLVTLKADNTIYGLSAPTMIKSPVSGIFEFNNNKLIKYGEEICRIKKYKAQDKERIIQQLEYDEIKQSVLKKERKKRIERETLDELISEGKIFNTYIKKNGNRETIPMEIASAVWNRDGGKCCICGSKENLEFDHIIPISKGGATSFRNLQLLCKYCNIKKSDKI